MGAGEHHGLGVFPELELSVRLERRAKSGRRWPINSFFQSSFERQDHTIAVSGQCTRGCTLTEDTSDQLYYGAGPHTCSLASGGR